METKPNNSQARTLIVLHGNRYIEVFSSERHPVKIVNVPHMQSIEGDLLIEEMLQLRLTQYWAKVYTDGFLVDRDAIREVSVTDLFIRDNDIALVKTMNAIIAKNMDVHQCRT